jgi:hypothetical protein
MAHLEDMDARIDLPRLQLTDANEIERALTLPMYAIRLNWNGYNAGRFLMPSGYFGNAARAWTTHNPRKARRLAKLLQLDNYNVVRLAG